MPDNTITQSLERHPHDDQMARFIACCESLAEQLRDNKTIPEAVRLAMFKQGVQDFLGALEVPEVKPLSAVMDQVTRDLGGKVRVEEG